MRVAVSPEAAELAPGQDVELLVTVINDGVEELAPVLAVHGVDPAFVRLPDRLVALAPGGQLTAIVAVHIPEDAIVGEQRLGVSVADAQGVQRGVGADVFVRVGARPDVALALDPPTVKGRRGATLDTVLRNHSDRPIDVRLEAAGEDVEVSFAADEVRLEPLEEVYVRTTVRRLRRSWWRDVRHGALIAVRGTGIPVSANLTYLQKPAIAVLWRKVVAVVAALAVWAAAVIVVNDQLLGEETDPDLLAGVDAEGDGESDASRDGDGDGPVDADAAGLSERLTVAGTVDGPRDLIGTDIVLERISFGDAGTTEAAGITKLAAFTPVALPRASVLDRIETSTDEAGRYSISGGLVPDAFYRVTALRPGFEVASVVVATSLEEPDLDVPITLVPASGSMSGRVLDQASRPLGGAQVNVTDGSMEYQTTSATEAGAGSWSLEGLATPATYQVVVTLPGYSSATRIVEVEGGEQAGGIDATLNLGLGTVRGRVLDSRDGSGVGAVTVELAGDEERTTTTLTDDGLLGAYDFPALAFGTYQLTFSATGWQTQTAEVVVDRGDVVVDVPDLRPATAVVQGNVLQQVAPGGCDYPDPEVPSQREQAEIRGCGGVGVRVTGENGTFSTTSSTGEGFFQLSSLPPGEYTLSFERYGYHTERYEISLSAGDVVQVPQQLDDVAAAAAAVRTTGDASGFSLASFSELATSTSLEPGTYVLMRLLPAPDEQVGVVQGVLRDRRAPTEVLDHADLPREPEITVDDQPQAEVELLADGAFEITRLAPGAQRVRVRAPGYDEAVFVARVGFDEPVRRPVILTPFASLDMRVTDGDDVPMVGSTVFVTTADQGLVDQLNAENADPAYDVRECTVRRDAADRWRAGEGGLPGGESLQGLCATVDDNAEARFNQALPTGTYDIIAPVDEVDLAETGSAEVRASVVPLDHAQQLREFDVRSGETTRPELRLQRYAVIQGRLRQPAEGSFVFVDDDVFGADRQAVIDAFPSQLPEGFGVDFTGELNGEPYTPPPGLRPRFSYGTEAGLTEGTYRIDRVLTDDANDSHEYEMEIRAADGSRARWESFNDTSIVGLGHGETRVLNGILSPRSLDVALTAQWERSDGKLEPIEGLRALLEGLVEFRIQDGLIDEIRGSIEVAGTAEDPSRLSTEDLCFPDGPCDDDQREAQFLEGHPLNVDLSFAAGGSLDEFYDADNLVDSFVIPAEDFVIADEDAPPVFEYPILLEPLPRTITGTLDVPVGDVSEILGGAAGDLAVSLQAVDEDTGADTSAAPIEATLARIATTNRVTFTLPDVPPDFYRLRITGDDIFPVDDVTFLLPPGSPGVTLGPDGLGTAGDFVLDRVTSLTVGVYESFDDAVSRVDGGTGVDELTVALRLNGAVVATEIADTDGQVTFDQLRGGSGRAYTVDVTRRGYHVVAGAALLDVGSLDAAVDLAGSPTVPILADADNTRAVEVERFGEVTGEVTSVVPDVGFETFPNPLWDPNKADPFHPDYDPTYDPNTPATVEQLVDGDAGPTAGATVRLCPTAACDGVSYSATTSDGSDGLAEGEFLLDRFLEVPDGTYWLVVTADGRSPLAVPGIDVVRGVRADSGEHVLRTLPSAVSGVVTDEAATPLPNVRVRLVDDTSGEPLEDAGGVPYVTVTAADGSYAFTGLPALGELAVERPVRVVFDEFADAALQVPTSRRTQEIEVSLLGGETANGSIQMLGEYVAVGGRIDARDFAGADVAALEGATVELRCVGGGCLNVGEGGAAFTATTQSDADGSYAFPVLPSGYYTMSVDAVGYDDLVVLDGAGAPEELYVFRFGEGDLDRAPDPDGEPPVLGIGNLQDATLTATPVTVTATVSSDDLLGGDGEPVRLEGVTVEAAYAGGGDAPAEADDGRFVFSATSGPSGEASLVVPPGDWTLSTVDADAATVAPRPHLDVADRGPFSVPADDGVAEVPDPSLALRAYVAVSGVVLGRDLPFTDAATEPVAGAIVTAAVDNPAGTLYGFAPDGDLAYVGTPTALGAGGTATDADGRFGLLVPPTVTGGPDVDWGFEVTAGGYDGASVEVTLADDTEDLVVDDTAAEVAVAALDGGTVPALTADGLVLTRSPLDLEVTVLGWDGTDEDALGGVTVAASWSDTNLGDDDPLDIVGAGYVASDDTANDGSVTLRLPPGTWDLTTDGGADLGYVDAGLDVTEYPGYPPVETTVVGGQANTEQIRLDAFAGIDGRVTDGEDGLRYVEVTVSRDTRDAQDLTDGVACSPAIAGTQRASTTTSGGGTRGSYDIQGLVPERVFIEYVEFTNQGVATGRRAELCRELAVGSQTLADVVLLVPGGNLQGTVTGALIDGAEELALGGLSVSVTAAGGSTPADTTTTDTGGLYRFEDLPPGDYTVSVTAPGYTGDTTSGAVTVSAATGANADFPLIAATRDVTVTVGSSAGTIGGLDGAGIDVTMTASYPSDVDPLVTIDRTVTSDDADDPSDVTFGDDTITFSDLPPGDWKLSSSGFDQLDEPHQDLDGADVTVPVDTAGDGTYTTSVTATRYPELSGSVVPLAETDGDVLDELVDATVTATDGTTIWTGTVGAFAAGDAPWAVFVDPQDTPRDITVTLDAPGFSSAGPAADVPVADVDVAVADPIELIAVPRDVEVTVVTSATDGSLADVAPASFQLQLGSDTGTAVQASTVDVDPDTTGDDGRVTVTFGDLRPGSWTLTTTALGELAEPHVDLVAGDDVTVDVTAGDGTFTRADDVTLTRYVVVSGSVVPRAFADGPALSTLAGATVTATSSGSAMEYDGEVEALDAGAAAWSVFVPPAASARNVTVTLAAPGFVDEPETVSVGASDVDVSGELVLLASPRDVAITVASSAGAGGLVGLAGSDVVLTLTTTYLDAADEPVVVTRTLDAADPGDAGAFSGDTVTFDGLAPATWTLSSTGLADVDEPHEDLVDETVVVPVDVDEDDAEGGVYAISVTATRYPVLAGALTMRAYGAADAPTFAPSDLEGAIEVTVSDDSSGSAVAVPAVATRIGEPDATTGAVPWTVFLAPDTSDGAGDLAVVVAAPGFPNDTHTATLGDAGLDGTVVAEPVAVEVTVEDIDSRAGVNEIELDATLLEEDPEDGWVAAEPQPTLDANDYDLTAETATVPDPDATQRDGVATLLLPPGRWQIDATDVSAAPTYYDSVLNGDGETPNYTPLTVDVAPTTSTLEETFLLQNNSVLTGTVVQDRGDGLEPVAGVTIRAERDGQRYSTVSTEPQVGGDNYRLRAQAGTWKISVVHDGVVTVVDEAFVIAKDGTGAEPNRLQIELPWTTAELAGVVTDGSGAAVTGATVSASSSLGTVTAATGDDGVYELAGLDPDVTWAVTYSPPDDVDAQPITRFIAPGGFASVQLTLDQRLPTGYGDLEVAVTDVAPGEELTVELVEVTPFPTMNAEGRDRRTATADAAGTAVVRFEGLVPGDGRSVPNDRFDVRVSARGTDRTRSNLEVLSGQTTRVEVVFNHVVVRDVELRLADADGPLTDRGVTLEQAGAVQPGTSEVGSDRYLFLGVEPGTWTVVVDGYLPTSVEVVAGDGVRERSLVLSVDPDAPVVDADEPTADGTTGDGATDDGTAGDGTAGDGTAGDGTADAPTTGDGTTGDGTADDGTADDGATDDGAAGDGTTDDTAPDDPATDDSGTADPGSDPVTG